MNKEKIKDHLFSSLVENDEDALSDIIKDLFLERLAGRKEAARHQAAAGRQLEQVPAAPQTGEARDAGFEAISRQARGSDDPPRSSVGFVGIPRLVEVDQALGHARTSQSSAEW